MNIRNATAADGLSIRRVYLEAFGVDERDTVAALAVALLATPSEGGSDLLHRVAESGGDVVGHVAFSPVWSRGRGALLGYLLAPLAVAPLHQGAGLGSRLVRSGLEELARRGVGVVLVYGDPDYYGRFGFAAGLAGPYVPPYKLAHPFGWQAVSLGGGEAGTPQEPVEIACVPAFDKPELW